MNDFNLTCRSVLIPNGGIDYSCGNSSLISFNTTGMDLSLANALANIPSVPAASAAPAAPAAPSLPTAPVAAAVDSYSASASSPQQTTQSAAITQADLNNAIKSLSGEELKKARTSTEGAYKVTDAHKEVATKMVEVAKEILRKSPEAITEPEFKKLEEVFSAARKNPMLAEAFVKESNNETFRADAAKTATLLGAYEQVLTKKNGRKAAQEEIKEIKNELEENVKERNSDEWSKFDKKSTRDSENVEYTFGNKVGEKVSKHPFSALTVGTVAAGAGVWGLSKLSFSTMAKTGKYGLALAGAAAITASVYNLVKED